MKLNCKERNLCIFESGMTLKSGKMRKKYKRSSLGGKMLVAQSKGNAFLGHIEPLLKMVKVIDK